VSGAIWDIAPVLALPQGGEVKSGQAEIGVGVANLQDRPVLQMSIRQSSDRAVINWQSFSVGSQEWVNFQQPSSTSATLNRVTGNTPSDIAGRITANGQIMLVNPNGILFTPTAQIDVAGLVATTLDISDKDFMTGTLHFNQVPDKPLKTVINQGNITVKDGGFAALVGPGVANRGVINARLGKVVLASGTQATMDFYGDGLVSLAVDPTIAGQIRDTNGQALTDLVSNSGTIAADGGTVTLSAKAGAAVVNHVINLSGVIQAQSVQNQNGKIVLSGGEQGTVLVSGNLDASGLESGQTGGTVQVLGERIGLLDGTRIDVSGDAGGGEALIGGNYQGQGPLPNAQFTFGGQNVSINANALSSGNGGKVIVWANDTTRFYGSIVARGGSTSGNGGLVETSGEIGLDVNGARVDTRAPNGQIGTWVLDPSDLTIQAGSGTDSNIGGSPNFNTLGSPATLFETNLEAALATSNVTISTAGGTEGNGDITLNATIDSASANSLTLTARRFNLTSGSFNLGGNLTFNLNQVNPEATPPTSSIQNAHNAIGTVAGTRTINLGAGTFQGATLTLNRNVTINGAGQGQTILNGQNTRQVVNIAAGTVNISNLTVSGGRVSLPRSFSAGGIFVAAGSTLNLSNSKVSGNTGVIGGGIRSDGRTTLSNSTVSNNSAIDGGGINNLNGTLTLSNSTVSGNTASNNGGGLHNQGTLTLTGSTVSGNRANGSGGGILGFTGTVNVSNSTVSGNTANFGGGGIFNFGVGGSTVNVSNSTVSGNRANGSGGGILGFAGTINVSNSTITNNTSDNDNNGSGNGGGVFRQRGTLNVANTIIAGNFDTPRNAGPGAINPDVSGVFTDQGNNLIGISNGSTSFTTSTLVGTLASPLDPRLGPLSDNGGPTQTHALRPGSPAIDAGSNELAIDPDTESSLTTDQRGTGFTRTFNGTTDIGAFESRGFALTPIAGTPQSTQVNTAFATNLQLQVTDTFGQALRLNDISVSFAAPGSGPSGTFSGSTTLLTNASGTVTAPTLTANGIDGNFNVTATSAVIPGTATFSLANTPLPTTTPTPASPAPPPLPSLTESTSSNFDETFNELEEAKLKPPKPSEAIPDPLVCEEGVPDVEGVPACAKQTP
jgi:filamentous hemagglutinin family protein